MQITLKYPWQQAVVDAFLELDPELLHEKIEIAEKTLTEQLNRSQRLDADERFALGDALHALHVFLAPSKDADNAKRRHAGQSN